MLSTMTMFACARVTRPALLTLPLLAGCNQLYGIEGTRLVDAAPREYFDAPIDAPFSCPPPGQTPVFSPLLRQVIAQNCANYTISTDRQQGAAICWDDSLLSSAALGPVDAPLTAIHDLDDPTLDLQFVRISPDGDVLIGTYYGSGPGYEIRVWNRQPDGSWLRGPNVLSAASYVDVSAPTRSPRHIVRTSNDTMLHELVQDGGTGTWAEIAAHSPATLGVNFPGSPKLSADGLRLLLVDQGRVVYTDRASLGSPFRAAEPLEGLPYVFDAFMTEDCSRVYFSGLQQVLYLQRQ